MMNNTAIAAGRDGAFTPAGEQVSLGSYTTYPEAQRVVDTLSDQHFPVESTQIIGSDLRMIEQITGRLTWPRALLSGAATGGWFGLFVGLVLSLLSTTSFALAMGWGLLWGVVFGMAFAAVGYALTRGRRDFTSMSVTVPSRYEVLVAADHAAEARTLLAGTPR